MHDLTKHITEQLERKESCVVFRPEIARVWPELVEMIARRNAAIEAFAKERGWAVEIVDPGVVVTFRKSAALHRSLVPAGERSSNGTACAQA